MKSQLQITKILNKGKIQNELEHERALIAERKLRLLSKEHPEYVKIRKELRRIIEVYETENWTNSTKISEEKIKESEIAELIAEEERLFIQNRKTLIKTKLKELNLKQQELGDLLGHSGKSYISELMNGLSPFSMKDLIVIHRILKIDLTLLIPTFLSHSDRIKLKHSIEKLNNPKLKLSKNDLIH